MGRIDLRVFGGILPSVDPHALPNPSGQVAKNLDMRFGDFRPCLGPGAAVTEVAAGTRSIFRTPSGVWLSSTADVDYVNGQINDAESERVYLTGRVAYPEAWQAGAYRRLGVPAPTSPPTLTVVTVDEFSTEEREAAANAIVAQIFAAIKAAQVPAILGAGVPSDAGTLSAIWLQHGADSELPTTAALQIAYCARYSGSTTVAASDAYLIDPLLGGKKITYAGLDYWAVPMTWQAAGSTINTSSLSSALKLIKTPPSNTVQLIPDATCDEIAARIAALYSAAVDPMLSRVNTLNSLQGEVSVQVLRTDTNSTRANALSTRIGQVRAAVQTIEAYYLDLNTNTSDIIGTLLREYEYLLPTAVQLQTETRAYIYTYVTEWGEESAPSPASELITLDQNDGVYVDAAVPDNLGPYGPIVSWRLYRSSTTNTGAVFQFVDEVNFVFGGGPDPGGGGGSGYRDIKLQEELQEPCQTLTWIEPPADLKGLVGLPNGIMAGFFGKTMCFCEPYHPYAWPAEYQETIEYNIVALGVFGTTLVVLTEGSPYYGSGSDSASMSLQKLESAQSCVSKRGVASAEGGVIYPSPDGICIAGPGGVEVVTLGAFDKKKWQSLGLENSFAAFSEGVYYIVTENDL